MLKHGQIAEVHDFSYRLHFQPGPQRLAVSRAHPLVGDDDAEQAILIEQLHASFDEVGVQIGRARVGLEVSLGVFLELLAQRLLPHIRRIANHGVKSARRHDLPETRLARPIEWLDPQQVFVIPFPQIFAAEKVAADEGIAPFDVAAQIGQDRFVHIGQAGGFVLVFQHLQKQRELADFDGVLIEVDAVDIVEQDAALFGGGQDYAGGRFAAAIAELAGMPAIVFQVPGE